MFYLSKVSDPARVVKSLSLNAVLNCAVVPVTVLLARLIVFPVIVAVPPSTYAFTLIAVKEEELLSYLPCYLHQQLIHLD